MDARADRNLEMPSGILIIFAYSFLSSISTIMLYIFPLVMIDSEGSCGIAGGF